MVFTMAILQVPETVVKKAAEVVAMFRVENPEAFDPALLKLPPQILTLYRIPGK